MVSDMLLLILVDLKVLEGDGPLYGEGDIFTIDTFDDGAILATPRNLMLPDRLYYDTARDRIYGMDGQPVERELLEKPKASSLAKMLAIRLDDEYIKKRFPRGCGGVYDSPDGDQLYFYIYAWMEDRKNNRFSQTIPMMIADNILDLVGGLQAGNTRPMGTCRAQ